MATQQTEVLVQAIENLGFLHLQHKLSGQELEEENVDVLYEIKPNGR